jgi:hypothetical protein
MVRTPPRARSTDAVSAPTAACARSLSARSRRVKPMTAPMPTATDPTVTASRKGSIRPISTTAPMATTSPLTRSTSPEVTTALSSTGVGANPREQVTEAPLVELGHRQPEHPVDQPTPGREHHALRRPLQQKRCAPDSAVATSITATRSTRGPVIAVPAETAPSSSRTISGWASDAAAAASDSRTTMPSCARCGRRSVASCRRPGAGAGFAATSGSAAGAPSAAGVPVTGRAGASALMLRSAIRRGTRGTSCARPAG